ncbi:ribonuclease HI family protein [Aquibacillus saliphilus]|uniref:ribonuclease HI family protein n=1 Tax=Aquibacillus saliphilus TaxID=1909422 RepID=UPI001CEFF7A3|nr:ribonuclease HI family protein [Aquibacillus saliphilus]
MIEIYTDGAANGDPGLSGAGVYIKEGTTIHEYSFHLGMLSNHEAEFWAVIKGIEICKQKFPNEILSFRSDSKLVVDLFEKEHTKNVKFIPLLERIVKDSQQFPFFFIKWIPEKKNQHADRLARQAIHM